MIIDGYKKGTQLQMDEYGLFYVFNGRNPINNIDIESYEVLSKETSKNVVSTVGRGLIGSALLGVTGISASLTGKENNIYIIRVNWDKYIWKDGRDYSVFELDQIFYKMFMMRCIRTPQYQKELEERRNKPPEKYLYDYKKWLQHNNLQNATKEELIYLDKPYFDALGDNPETNPILDCCRSINPKWEEYIKQQEQVNQQQVQPTTNSTSDIKSKLQQLKSMYEENLITEEEYNSKKQELLAEL